MEIRPEENRVPHTFLPLPSSLSLPYTISHPSTASVLYLLLSIPPLPLSSTSPPCTLCSSTHFSSASPPPPPPSSSAPLLSRSSCPTFVKPGSQCPVWNKHPPHSQSHCKHYERNVPLDLPGHCNGKGRRTQ